MTNEPDGLKAHDQEPRGREHPGGTHPGETADHVIDDESGTLAIYDPDEDEVSPATWITADESAAIDKGDWR